ncbi:MAG: hypothetical protein LBR38_06960 [Synergistaceae bacterium]|nr:hypothetical protein [Synergistaceae bacterium]
MPVLVALLVFFASGPQAEASSLVASYGPIDGAPGLRFENVEYGWDVIAFDMVNMTDSNAFVGGMMVFVDRFGLMTARVLLPHRKVPAGQPTRFIGSFMDGTGESARRAERIIWNVRVERW